MLISIPRTRSIPTSPAVRAASVQPSAVSWSVSPSTSSPASFAARTSSSAVCVPSLARVWVWRSMRTPATLGGLASVAAGGMREVRRPTCTLRRAAGAISPASSHSFGKSHGRHEHPPWHPRAQGRVGDGQGFVEGSRRRQ